MFRTLSLYLLSAVIAYSAPYGGTVLSAGQATFDTSAWNGGMRPNNNGTPWFDLTSPDGTACNAAYYISGRSSGCLTSTQPGGVDRLSGTSGSYAGPDGPADFWRASSPSVADLNFNFAPDSPAFAVQLMVEATNFASDQEFGIYWIGADTLMRQMALIDGSDNPLTRVAFTPGSVNFGFYIDTGTYTFFTESRYNRTNATGAATDTDLQHFAIFRDPSDTGNTGANFDNLWIAIENSNGTTAPQNRDWNDMILAMWCLECSAGAGTGSPQTVPEPETHALIGIGLTLITLAQLRRRRH